nr:hypothetical protein [Halorientalis brevis]
MGINECGPLVIHCRGSVIHLEMDWAEIIVGIVLVPANQQTSGWLDPVEPVVLVRASGLELESGFDPRLGYWIAIIVEESSRIHVDNDAVRTSLSRFGTPATNGSEVGAESILDPIVEPLALQVGPVCEKDDH